MDGEVRKGEGGRGKEERIGKKGEGLEIEEGGQRERDESNI